MTSESTDNSWWSSWLTSAKEKSVNALSVTKRDLAEFVTVLSSDTKAAVSGAGANIKGLIQTPGAEKGEDESRQKTISHSAEVPTAPYDRCQAQLFTVQKTVETYLSDPKDDDGKFSEWKANFDVQAHQSEISQLLVNCSHVRSLHAQLVPAQVSYESFWLRYFYKVQLLQEEEQRRAELMARAKRKEEPWKWDEDAEEVAPVVETKASSDHHRSESSDSFVCVSEEPPNGSEKEQEGVDTESWESVGAVPEEKPRPSSDQDSDWENWDD